MLLQINTQFILSPAKTSLGMKITLPRLLLSTILLWTAAPVSSQASYKGSYALPMKGAWIRSAGQLSVESADHLFATADEKSFVARSRLGSESGHCVISFARDNFVGLEDADEYMKEEFPSHRLLENRDLLRVYQSVEGDKVSRKSFFRRGNEEWQLRKDCDSIGNRHMRVEIGRNP